MNIDVTNMKSYLESMSKLRKSCGNVFCIEDLVMQYGGPSQVPSQDNADKFLVKRYGPAKTCFETSLLTAIEKHADKENVYYCEGYAYSNFGIPVEHAWIEHNGVLVETVWDELGLEYFGIRWHPAVAAECVKELGYYGILSSLYRVKRNHEKWFRDKNEKNLLTLNGSTKHE